MEIVIQQLLERLEIQGRKKVKNFPFLMGQGVWIGSENLSWEDTLEEIIKQGTLTIGFIGLAECLKALIGEHHGESEEAQKLGLKIVGHMREICDEATETVSYTHLDMYKRQGYQKHTEAVNAFRYSYPTDFPSPAQ